MGVVRSFVVVGLLAVVTAVAVTLVVTAGASGQGPSCAGRVADRLAAAGQVTVGTEGADVIAGTSGPDVIRGRGGADVICGRGGNDVIRGNGGRDTLVGGPGDDVLRGGRSRDRLRGGRGADELRGQRGIDDCRGGPGRDRLLSCNEAPLTPTPTPTPSGSSAPVRFVAAGDFASGAETTASLQAMAGLDPRFVLALGDFSYAGPDSEAGWCSYVRSHLPDTPFQLVAGNHEDDGAVDGHIDEFAACLPDAMGSTGTYGAEYWFDVDATVRVIMLAAGSTVGGVDHSYVEGGARYEWLASVIDDARADGIPWVIVGMHKVCVSAGEQPCQIGTDLVGLLSDKRVDLVLQGHDHTYQRSKQLTCAEPGVHLAGCVADDGADGRYAKGGGPVWVVSGAAGSLPLVEIRTFDPEIEYFAAWMGAGHPQAGRGFVEVTVSATELSARWVGSTSAYTDQFVIG